MRIQWPSDLDVHLRLSPDLPAARRTERGGTTAVELSLDNVRPIPLPKGAPARYAMIRYAQLTDFDSWADLGALMAPLYARTATIPAQGPLHDEVERIRAASQDPAARAEAALALVQDRIRYVALSMGTGGLVPADAETTWSRRYGDCKGKTVLLLAILHALGIEAEPVAVNATNGDGIDQQLPAIAWFNHVLVRAHIGGRDYWLDGTRTGDRRLADIRVPGFRWGLPLIASGATLVPIMPPPLERPTSDVTVHIDASAGLTAPATAHVEAVLRGDDAVSTNMSLANLDADARDRALRDYWRGEYDFIDVRSTSASFDAATGEERLVMDGTAHMDWSNGYYEADGMRLGYNADFDRDAGPNRDAPFAVNYPFFTRNVETIVLPPDFRSAIDPSVQVDRTIAGVEYRRHASISDNVFTAEASARSVVPEFPASEAPAAQAALRELNDSGVFLTQPNGYRPTAAEIEAARADTPGTARELIRRGDLLMDQGLYDDAITVLSRAVAMDAHNALALADRGIAYAWTGKEAEATHDLDAAEAIDPRNAVVPRARGLLAQRHGAYDEAIRQYGRALELEPDSAFALGHRAESYLLTGDTEHALADAAAAIARVPTWINMRLVRARALHRQGHDDLAIAEIGKLVADNPDDAGAHASAAAIYSEFDRREDALREFGRAIALHPEADLYLARASAREKTDFDGRRADIEEALRQEPRSIAALAALARLHEDRGDLAGAIRSWTAVLSAKPDDDDSAGLVARGIAYARNGQDAPAQRDFAAARRPDLNSAQLNNMCWAKAIAGVALESALADCEAALRLSPDSATALDSRGFVLLRLGRLDEAIGDFDRALARAPSQAASLFARAVAYARKGDRAHSQADLAAAERIAPRIREIYAGYGVTF
jgi:tetratricopeptide (TPR) repeat protein